MPTGPFTLEEATFVAVLTSVGGIVGNFAVLPLAQRLGYARSICLMGVPMIVSLHPDNQFFYSKITMTISLFFFQLSNILLIVAQHKYLVYISRVLSGFGGGVGMVAIPSMIPDISSDKYAQLLVLVLETSELSIFMISSLICSVRGSLNSLMDPALNFGIVLSCVLGNYFTTIDQVKIQLIFPILLVVFTMFLPQTPDYWVQRNEKEVGHLFVSSSCSATFFSKIIL